MYSSSLLEGLIASTTHFGTPIIVDSFAGGGGASTGIELALGRSPDIAINHNPAALALHAANHPDTLHLSENVYRIDPLDHLRGRHVGLAWFSPDCKDFSKAKGGTPVSKNIRDLAWIIPGWTERIQQSGGKVDVIIMENVEEFAQWGPVIETEKGLMPDPGRRGETFQKWCKKLRSLGGKIQRRELRGYAYGAPTIRKRLFIIIRFDGLPIVWPKETHGAPDDPDVIAGRKLPWRTAAEIIDWSIPCPSIFDTGKDIFAKFGLRAVRPLADNTMARIARGMKRYVLEAERAFLVSVAHGESGGRREYPLTEPYGVVTAGGISHSLAVPHLSAFYGPGTGGQDRSAPVNEPLRVIPTENRHAVVSPILTYAQQGGRSRSVDEPAHTICASAKDQNQVAAAFLAQNNYMEPGHSVREPLSTIVGKGSTQSVVQPFISRQFGTATGHSIERPLATVTAGGDRAGSKTAMVAPFMQKYYGIGDGSQHDEPCHTITVKDRHGHVEAMLSAPPFTPDMEARARQVADFLRAHGAWDDREFVTIEVGDATFVIVDIGMRMLTPRELYNAQGFPGDYEIERGADGTTFSKSVQVSCVGNSVCPPVAAALVAANCGHLAREPERLAA